MDAWEQFGRKVMAEMWSGAMEIDCADVQDWAEKAGLIVEERYDPAVHGDGLADFDVEPGDLIHTYAPQYKTEG